MQFGRVVAALCLFGLAALPATADRRSNAFAVRREAQRARLALPLFPTTTIGSFPQTDEIRSARAAYKRNELSETAYRAVIGEEIAQAVHRQEEIGLDVLVHGGQFTPKPLTR